MTGRAFNVVSKHWIATLKSKLSRISNAASVVFSLQPSPDNPKAAIGYYTLSSLSIELNQLPEKLARKLLKHSVPAALIGRLAVGNAARGQGVGKMLLADAIKRTLVVSDQIAIYAMVVDAINDSAKGFYKQFGFTHLSDDSPRLFLPLKSIES